MTDILDPGAADPDMSGIDDVATAIDTLARTHGITAVPEPVDAFVEAATRLCAVEVTFDHTERLLLGLARAGLVTDEQRFALHAAYLRQRGDEGLSVQ